MTAELVMVLLGEPLVRGAGVAVRVRAVSVEIEIEGDAATVTRAVNSIVAAVLPLKKVRAGAKETRPARVSRRRTA